MTDEPDDRPAGRATFVLVHGAWHGGWCWRAVRQQLQALGHDVHTPTLTGLAERSHLLDRSIGLDTHIADVANLLRWEELGDVVLCGHSYGGCVISGVAEEVPERIGSLLYLDAIILDDGQSQQDSIAAEHRVFMSELAETGGDGWLVPTIPAEALGLDADQAAWAQALMTPHPFATMNQPLRITEASRGIADIRYLLGSRSNFAPFAEKAQALGWTTSVVDSGHEVMIERPGETVAALLAAAAAVERRAAEMGSR